MLSRYKTDYQLKWLSYCIVLTLPLSPPPPPPLLPPPPTPTMAALQGGSDPHPYIMWFYVTHGWRLQMLKRHTSNEMWSSLYLFDPIEID